MSGQVCDRGRKLINEEDRWKCLGYIHFKKSPSLDYLPELSSLGAHTISIPHSPKETKENDNIKIHIYINSCENS